MIVMALPVYSDALDPFPNPIVLQTKSGGARRNAAPDRGLIPGNVIPHCPFLIDNNAHQSPMKHNAAHVYSYYYTALGMENWINSFSHQAAGHLAYQNETDVYGYSFHGHMASILDGNREETQGSGHLGPNFVGVASVREGRGMLPRGMPTLAHLV